MLKLLVSGILLTTITSMQMTIASIVTMARLNNESKSDDSSEEVVLVAIVLVVPIVVRVVTVIAVLSQN